MLPNRSSVKLDRGCSYSFSDIATRFIDAPHEDHLHLPSLQARTLPPIKKPIPTSASKPTSQRVQIATSVPMPISPPSMQAKQPGLRTAGVHNLLNPTKGDDHANTGSEPRSPLRRAADSSDSTTTLTLPSARSPHLQQSQEHPSFQTQYCEDCKARMAMPQTIYASRFRTRLRSRMETQDQDHGLISHSEKWSHS